MSKPKLEANCEYPITREELLAVLADDGYSAGQRTGRLKAVLTQLSAENEAEPGDSTRLQLINEIKDILGEQIEGEAIAQDTL